MKQTLDHGVEGIDPVLFNQVRAIGLTPGIEKFIRGKK